MRRVGVGDQGRRHSRCCQLGRASGIHTAASGLKYKVLRSADGQKPGATDTVRVNYRGTLDNGMEFDSTYGKAPVTLQLSGVIAGWSEGLRHCPVGGKSELEIPPNLGYGEKGTGSIPGGATLHFTIELLEIQ